MIKKIKRWLVDNFLPMWAKETVLRDNRQLQKECEELKHKLEVQAAYMAGMEVGTRALRRIVINNNGRLGREDTGK